MTSGIILSVHTYIPFLIREKVVLHDCGLLVAEVLLLVRDVPASEGVHTHAAAAVQVRVGGDGSGAVEARRVVIRSHVAAAGDGARAVEAGRVLVPGEGAGAVEAVLITRALTRAVNKPSQSFIVDLLSRTLVTIK